MKGSGTVSTNLFDATKTASGFVRDGHRSNVVGHSNELIFVDSDVVYKMLLN